MSLAERLDADELMDADDLDPAVYGAVMADLARVNRVTLAARPTLAFLGRIATGAQRLRILDVGFGDGDMLRRIARWAARRGSAVELTGIDLNPRSEAAARAHTPSGTAVEWITGDYRDLAGRGWDAVISSLVAHHMTRDQLVAFVRFMEKESARGWFVNDLRRSGFAYRTFPWLARFARWHPMVRADGTTSITRSFRKPEWAPILAEAGITQARTRSVFPFRLCVERLR